MTALTARLSRLEQRHRSAHPEPRRVFSCIVRHGREEADQAEAFAALGTTPAATDLVVRRVIVGPAGRALGDIEPKARLLSTPES